MADQTYQNHTRTDPAFHFVVAPILLANLIAAIVHAVRTPAAATAWAAVVALALLMLAMLLRAYCLKVQDRVILLEERIRMAALMPMESRAVQRELSTRQLIALRFASDAELAGLAERAVREKLTPKAIKQQIVNWKADTHRV
jgi:hypothetical protein